MNQNLQAFMRVLDPADNLTGGGAASAIAGSMGAALVGMVARLSIGRRSMPDPDTFYQKINQEAVGISSQLFDGAQKDSLAFDDLMKAYRLPKGTPNEQDHRRKAIQDAQISATYTPLENAKLCLQSLRLCTRLHERSNPNAASDLECAWHLAYAGLKGCLSNISINLESIKDERHIETIKQSVSSISSTLKELERLFPVS